MYAACAKSLLELRPTEIKVAGKASGPSLAGKRRYLMLRRAFGRAVGCGALRQTRCRSPRLTGQKRHALSRHSHAIGMVRAFRHERGIAAPSSLTAASTKFQI